MDKLIARTRMMGWYFQMSALAGLVAFTACGGGGGGGGGGSDVGADAGVSGDAEADYQNHSTSSCSEACANLARLCGEDENTCLSVCAAYPSSAVDCVAESTTCEQTYDCVEDTQSACPGVPASFEACTYSHQCGEGEHCFEGECYDGAWAQPCEFSHQCDSNNCTNGCCQ